MLEAETVLPECPNLLPTDVEGELSRLASLWAKHPIRPRIRPETAAHWDDLIASWAADDSLPLLIRKRERGVARGEVVIHDTGRELVLTDNSPAWWSYLGAFSERLPSLSDVRSALMEDTIPVTMVVDREMVARSRYRCCTVGEPGPNTRGWKVCHKREVGLGGRHPFKHRPLNLLQAHFRDFLSPSNMFLVPLLLGGLGELPQFIEAISHEPHGL
jgi:hypothetical protein